MERYVIIGNSAAGLSAAAAIRQTDRAGRVIMVSSEPCPSYSRVLLSYYLEGEVDEEGLFWRGADAAARLGVEEKLGRRATALDLEARRVSLEDGEELEYTRLLLATGARPQTLDVPGAGLAGVNTLRTLADARAIRDQAARSKRAVVVGGGLVALKAACALRKLGLEVTLAVTSGRILSRNLDTAGAEIVQRHLEEYGLRFRLGVAVEAFEGDRAGRVRAAALSGGKALPCDLVVVGKGVEPNVELARNAGLAVRRGIVCGEYLETSRPGVYAAGDVCESRDLLTGRDAVRAIWPSAVAQGKTAGCNMAGRSRRYAGHPGMNSVVLAGLPVVAAGEVEGGAPGAETLVRNWPGERVYKRVVLRDGRVVGVVLVGDIAAAGVLVGLLRAGAGVDGFKEHLLDDGFFYRG